jgi:hypothetical protein
VSKSYEIAATSTRKTSQLPSEYQQSERVQAQLKELPHLDRKGLQKLWLELFGVRPNPQLRRELLVFVLTYRIQEKAYGGLKPSTRKNLLSYAEGFDKDAEPATKRPRITKPGTRIVREWGSKLHEVTVLESGFDYEGKRYGSLSEIARVITGVRWSGPLFFGIKKRGKAVAA